MYGEQPFRNFVGQNIHNIVVLRDMTAFEHQRTLVKHRDLFKQAKSTQKGMNNKVHLSMKAIGYLLYRYLNYPLKPLAETGLCL
ncbi:hypothetical protein B5X24_HaOG201690 [Helicoverpa armigera]|nr:hypothetical protein B5X24_HaOG201690 [Helicoverpa armigera]